jgi:putative aldouronate transport system substrate-binding protein
LPVSQIFAQRGGAYDIICGFGKSVFPRYYFYILSARRIDPMNKDNKSLLEPKRGFPKVPTIRKIAGVLSLLVFFACGGNNQDRQAPAPEGGALNPPGVLPIAKEKITLKIAMPTAPWVIDYNTNAFTRWIEEQTNIHLEFDLYPMGQQEATQKLNILVSSGGELPDIIFGFFLSEQMIYNYGREEVILPLNNYYDTVAANFKAIGTKTELKPDDMIKYITSPDGNIYGYPLYTEQNGNARALRAWIHKGWLEKLGLAMPATTDEFYQVLKAFKEQDPNGNGVADEIPFVGSTDGWNSTPHLWVMNAFLYVDNTNYWVVENGKLSLAYNRPEWKEGLVYANKLCREGLLSPLSFSQTNDQLRTIAAGGDRAVVGVYVDGSPESPFGSRNLRTTEYAPLGPLTGPGGVKYATHTLQSPGIGLTAFISAACKNPEAAFRLMDFLWSEEAFYRSRFGIPRQDFEYADPSEKALFADMGYTPTIKIINETWGKEQNVHWYLPTLHCQLAEYIDGMVWDGDPTGLEYLISFSVPLYKPFGPKEEVYRLVYAGDVIDEVAEIQTNLTSYRDESTARFITGDLDINTQWDAYLNELKAIGIDRYIRISQETYDRMNE